MQKNNHSHITFASRLLLGFLFIYHGLVPKILWLSPVEVQLVSVSGLGIPAAIASPLAGVGEVILGCIIIFFKTSTIPIYLAAIVLLFLLIYVGIASPEHLIGAFNPVTTNIMGLGFCYLILYAKYSENV